MSPSPASPPTWKPWRGPGSIVRGDLNTTNLTYGSTNLPLNGVHTWTLAGKGLPGSEVEVVLGLDRAAMGGSVGDLFAGISRSPSGIVWASGATGGWPKM